MRPAGTVPPSLPAPAIPTAVAHVRVTGTARPSPPWWPTPCAQAPQRPRMRHTVSFRIGGGSDGVPAGADRGAVPRGPATYLAIARTGRARPPRGRRRSQCAAARVRPAPPPPGTWQNTTPPEEVYVRAFRRMQGAFPPCKRPPTPKRKPRTSAESTARLRLNSVIRGRVYSRDFCPSSSLGAHLKELGGSFFAGVPRRGKRRARPNSLSCEPSDRALSGLSESSAGRTRTYNPPVNSRMLCH
jgi:hypothetical protein